MRTAPGTAVRCQHRLEGELSDVMPYRMARRRLPGSVLLMRDHETNRRSDIESISAVTLTTHDMARSVDFYMSLGFELLNGGVDAAFSSFSIGDGYLNLIARPGVNQWSGCGRLIFHVSDVGLPQGCRTGAIAGSAATQC